MESFLQVTEWPEGQGDSGWLHYTPADGAMPTPLLFFFPQYDKISKLS